MIGVLRQVKNCRGSILHLAIPMATKPKRHGVRWPCWVSTEKVSNKLKAIVKKPVARTEVQEDFLISCTKSSFSA